MLLQRQLRSAWRSRTDSRSRIEIRNSTGRKLPAGGMQRGPRRKRRDSAGPADTGGISRRGKSAGLYSHP